MDEDQTPRHTLIDMAQGYFRGKTLCAVVRLGIADALGDGERTLDELSSSIGTDRDTLHRLLRALAGIDIVRHNPPDRFALTPLGLRTMRRRRSLLTDCNVYSGVG